MPRVLHRLAIVLRALIGLALGFLALPWCIDVLVEAVRRHAYLPQDPWAVILGLALGLVLILFKKPNLLLHTALHEASHAALCLMTGVRIRRVEFSDGKGGAVDFDRPDPIRATLIAIAPYTLPLLLAPALVARMWVHRPGPWRTALTALVAFLLVTHLAGLVRNLRGNFWGAESDLAKVGRLLALVLILGVLLLVLAWTITVLWER